jgi:FtsH-binding integral membrane protein
MARALEAALGVWLVLSGPQSQGQLLALVGGAAIILLVLAERPSRARRHVGFSVVLVGCGLMLAPLVLGYTSLGEVLREVLTGLAVTAIALVPGRPGRVARLLGREVRRPARA